MKILYGVVTQFKDVTDICYTKLFNINTNIIKIPCTDGKRAHYFGDPILGTLKKIFIIDAEHVITEYDETKTILIDTISLTITTTSNLEIIQKTETIHKKLQLKYGSFKDELPEQQMAVRYLSGNEKVLEIGGNIGRNTLIIASILGDNQSNLVSLECDANISNQLQENRDLNKFTFHIENSALSKRKLIQRGWDTIPSDVLIDGYTSVNILTFEEIQQKYNIVFDTLVLDCEGAFYYILMDMPEILTNIKTIIMENDYWDITKKQYVDEVLRKNNFKVDYSESGGWGPCFNNFFEVWIHFS